MPTDPVSLIQLALIVGLCAWAIFKAGVGSPRHDPPPPPRTAEWHEDRARCLLQEAETSYGVKYRADLTRRAQAHASIAQSMRMGERADQEASRSNLL